MNNILLFRRRASATALPIVRALPAKAPIAGRIQRPVLVAVWHTNPRTGKRECRWTTEPQGMSEEDGSHGRTCRRAA